MKVHYQGLTYQTIPGRKEQTMSKKQDYMMKITKAIDTLAIINRNNMTVNELLFAISRTDIHEPFVNLTNEDNGEFHFGFAEGFWPVRDRALKVVRFGIWIDDETGSVAIEVVGKAG